MKEQFPNASRGLRRGFVPGFTLIELLAVIAVIAVLSSLFLPALAKAKARGQAIVCLNNLKQLNLAWMVYADDNNDRLAYNLGATEIKQMLARGQRFNWANSVLNWELDSDNTNTTLNTEAALGSYVGRNSRIFRCPADFALSSIQKRAGWSERSRSISMNAMVGDAGEFTFGGTNVNNPDYRQFLKLGEFPSASEIFVFIEEHPDSINDGYFLNRWGKPEWTDLPASYHHGAANLTFGDGHGELHRWLVPSTTPPPRPDAAGLPFALNENERIDFYWLLRRTSMYHDTHD